MKITKLNVPFAQVPNDLLNDPNLSLKAKGLWAYIQSKPNDYNFSSERICEETKDEVRGIQNTLKELEEAGYLKRERQQSGKVDYVLVFPLCSFSRQPISPSAKTADISNNKNYIEDSNNNIDITYTSQNSIGEIGAPQTIDFFVKIQGQEYFYELTNFFASHLKAPPAFISQELIAFVSYWTEPTHSGKKQRWQTEKTFEPKRRLATWFRNKKDWSRLTDSKYQVNIPE